MLSKIHHLESTAKELDPCVEQRQTWASQVIQHSEKFLATLETEESKAFNKTEHDGSPLLESPIKEDPTSMEKLLLLFRDNVEKNGLVESHGGHMAYVNSGGLYPSSLADYLAGVVNPYSAMFHDSPGSVRIENMVLKWMASTFGYPESFAGNLTSGGSTSTILAFATARDSKNIKARDFNKCVIYSTMVSHYCAEKALNTIGMREVVRRTIAVDENYKMDADALRDTVKKDIEAGLVPFIIYSTAGTTDVGSIDPLEDIAQVAKDHDVWMHVDACYGGFFILSQEASHLFKGIERSDSVCVDPHKSLFIPYGCGAVLVKEGSKLAYSNALNRPAFYLEDSFSDECQEEPSPCNLSFELSRHFRGLRVWMPLKLFGVRPFRSALGEKMLLARYFYERLAETEGFQLGPYPELSTVVFRFVQCPCDKEEFNKQLLDQLMMDGRVALASTRLNGVYFLRICILCFRTHIKEIDLLLKLISIHVNKMLKAMSVKPWEQQEQYVRG